MINSRSVLRLKYLKIAALSSIVVLVCVVFSTQAKLSGAIDNVEQKDFPRIIKSIRESCFDVVYVNGEYIKGNERKGRFGTLSDQYDYKLFNKNGLIIEEQKYTADDSVATIVSYRYDDDNRLLEKIVQSRLGYFDIHKWTYEYDDENSFQYIRRYKNDELIALFEDEYIGDKILLSVEKRGDSSIRQMKKFEYDSLGNCERISLMDSVGIQTHWEVYQYDSLGVKTTYTKHSEKNGMRVTLQYKYDDYGNLLRAYLIKNDPRKIIDRTYEHEYDEFNNWIRRYCRRNNKLLFLQEREIEYY